MSELLKKKVAFLRTAATSGLDAAIATAPSDLPPEEKAALSTLSATDLHTLADIYEKIETNAVGDMEHFGSIGF